MDVQVGPGTKVTEDWSAWGSKWPGLQRRGPKWIRRSVQGPKWPRTEVPEDRSGCSPSECCSIVLKSIFNCVLLNNIKRCMQCAIHLYLSDFMFVQSHLNICAMYHIIKHSWWRHTVYNIRSHIISEPFNSSVCRWLPCPCSITNGYMGVPPPEKKIKLLYVIGRFWQNFCSLAEYFEHLVL